MHVGVTGEYWELETPFRPFRTRAGLLCWNLGAQLPRHDIRRTYCGVIPSCRKQCDWLISTTGSPPPRSTQLAVNGGTALLDQRMADFPERFASNHDPPTLTGKWPVAQQCPDLALTARFVGAAKRQGEHANPFGVKSKWACPAACRKWIHR